jgi:hypothetical protein
MPGLEPRRLSIVVLSLRWLAGELARDRHPLAHLPEQLADALLAEPDEAGCRVCGGPLPVPLGVGRPRVRCERCSPPRRKPIAKSTMAASTTR